MGIRETYGAMLETVLNAAVDKHLNADLIKEQLHKSVDEMVDKHLADVRHKLKAEVIDLIDGEDDLQ